MPRTLAALPLASLIQTKALLMRTRKERLKAAVAEENAALDRLVGGPANREAVRAFQEKRLADFTGTLGRDKPRTSTAVFGRNFV